MSAEAPQQIDLNQDLQTQGIHLSPDQQENYESFLNKLEEQDKQDIIYLTQQELGEFKKLLEGDDSAYQNADFDEFIDTQREEGLSLSDMLTSTDDIPDILKDHIEKNIDGLEDIAREQLFGDTGVFSSLDISETAKDHMAISMSVSFMTHGISELQTKIEAGTISESDMQDFAALGAEMEQKFDEIKAVVEQTQTSDSGDIPYESVIKISSQGELNSIFMNPSEGVVFFDKVLSGDITAANVKQELENANKDLPEQMQSDITGPTVLLNKSINDISEAILTMDPNQRRDFLTQLTGAQVPSLENTDTITLPNNEEKLPEETEKNFFERIMELIKDMLSGLIKIDTSKSSNSGTDTSPVEESQQQQDTIQALKDSLLGKLSEGAFTGMQESSLKEFFGDKTQLESVSNILKQIPTLGEQDTDIEKLENLFFTPIESNENTMKIDAFVEAGGLKSYKNADNSLNSEKLMGILTAYSNYRIAHSEDTSLSYEAYFTNMSE